MKQVHKIESTVISLRKSGMGEYLYRCMDKDLNSILCMYRQVLYYFLFICYHLIKIIKKNYY